MKSEDYVKTVTSELRCKLDDDSYNPTLDNVFHRNYTKGFIFGEDKSEIVDSSKRTNEGAFIGSIIGMYKFRHKTQKPRFYIGIPIIITLQILFVIYLIIFICCR